MYGKVDQVPGLFHVATEFFCLNFLPLVPLRSYLILEGLHHHGGSDRVRIGLSGKSILMTWFRLGVGLAGIGFAIASAITVERCLRGPRLWSLAVVRLTITAGLGLLYWGSYRFTRAGPLRALKLATLAGIPPETVAPYFVDHPETDRLLEEYAHAQETLDR